MSSKNYLDLIKSESHQYYITQEITEHQDGMGRVYLARDEKQKQVVVKTINPYSLIDAQELSKQLANEADILKKCCECDGIAKYIEFFEFHNRPYLIMQYIEGTNLEQLLRKHRSFPEEQVKEWVTQILKILDYLHETGEKPIYHRDIKPSNILIDNDNCAYLIDFGTSKLEDKKSPNTAYISLGFAAPETLQHIYDRTSELYSLAIVIICLLTGRQPSSFDFYECYNDFRYNISDIMKNLLKKATADYKSGKRFNNAQEMMIWVFHFSHIDFWNLVHKIYYYDFKNDHKTHYMQLYSDQLGELQRYVLQFNGSLESYLDAMRNIYFINCKSGMIQEITYLELISLCSSLIDLMLSYPNHSDLKSKKTCYLLCTPEMIIQEYYDFITDILYLRFHCQIAIKHYDEAIYDLDLAIKILKRYIYVYKDEQRYEKKLNKYIVARYMAKTLSSKNSSMVSCDTEINQPEINAKKEKNNNKSWFEILLERLITFSTI